MPSPARTRIAAALLACGAVLGTGTAALATPVEQVPPDVRAAFAGDALRSAQAAAQGVDADFSGDVRADDIHEAFVFSPEFVDGTSTTEPVTPAGYWIAPITRGDEVLGTLLVGKPDGRAEMLGVAGDVDLGVALTGLGPTEILVDDAPNGSWWALDGDRARPLNDWARDALPRPGDLAELQAAVAEQTALAREPVDDPSGRAWGLRAAAVAIVAVFVLVFGGLAVLDRRRRRVGAAEPTPAR